MTRMTASTRRSNPLCSPLRIGTVSSGALPSAVLSERSHRTSWIPSRSTLRVRHQMAGVRALSNGTSVPAMTSYMYICGVWRTIGISKPRKNASPPNLQRGFPNCASRPSPPPVSSSASSGARAATTHRNGTPVIRSGMWNWLTN